MTKYLIVLLMTLGLAACGGSSGGPSASGSSDSSTDNSNGTDGTGDDKTTDDLIEDGETTKVSFLPLMTFEKYKEWSGMENGSLVYQVEEPFISHFIINTVDAANLSEINTAKIEDFDLSEDGIPLNPKANFQMLQKIVGNQTHLSTAIVINTSSAMDSVDKAAFINEIKAFIANAKKSSNASIANQAFTIWAYDGSRVQGDGGIVDETKGFKTDATTLNTALSTVLSKWQNGSYGIAGANHTYDAVIEAIGRFVGSSPFGVEENLRNDVLTKPNEINDLVDEFTANGIHLTNLILFSAGFSDTNRFNGDFMIQALESQSLSSFDTEAGPSGAATSTKDLGKLLFYVVPANETQDDVIKGVATATIEASYNSGVYSFASTLLSKQTTAVTQRVSVGNQYLIRFASSIRSGKDHVGELKTRTADSNYGYKLTWKMDREEIPVGWEGMPDPQVEITGAGNEYLSEASASLSDISRFYPATRWTNTEYAKADYEWTSTLNLTTHDDGSVSIANSGTGTLTLRNTKLNESTTISIVP